MLKQKANVRMVKEGHDATTVFVSCEANRFNPAMHNSRSGGIDRSTSGGATFMETDESDATDDGGADD